MNGVLSTLRTILRKIIPNEIPKPVGRWRIEKCNKQMINKIDLSNEDHCGPCGQYALEKVNLKPFSVENAESNVAFSLENRRELGDLHVKRWKKNKK